MSTYTVETIVHGYHVYQVIWEAAVGQVLPCQWERGNVHDPYAVAIVERGVVVGHVPRAISSVCYLFLGKSGTISCQVTGTKHYSRDLPQGGLEVPCKLIFSGESRLIIKVRKLLQEAFTSGLLTSCGTPETDSNPPQESPDKQRSKKRRIEQGDSDTWVQFNGIVLSHLDKDQLREGRWLNDKHVNCAQYLLKKQFPHIDGWRETLLVHKKQKKIKQGVQIIHTHGNHWIVASTLGSKTCDIQIFDSLYSSVDKETQNIIFNLFESNGQPKLTMSEISKQDGVNDCGVFAIAAATVLAFGSAPVQLQQSGMRQHLLKCFEDGSMTPFPTI